MSKINEIQKGILQLEGGRYQKLLDCYLYKKYNYENWTFLGSQTGTDKTTKGTPDTYIRTPNGKYVFLMYGTVQSSTFSKVKEDIESCLDESKTGICIADIEEIICCHTSARFTAGEHRELHNLYPDLKLIGISELSMDLRNNYPGLAKEFLDVSIDTGQILDDMDFVGKYEEGGFATPLSNLILFRENEIAELKNCLEKSDVIVICGKSGSGKTRLALEVGRQFCHENNYDFKCIKQNGQPIYEDLKSHFVDEANYLVFVDDANMLVHLSNLLELCIDKGRKHKLKIIITVRDYAISEILKLIKTKALPEQYELKALAPEEIEEILKQEFAIINSDYLEQIIKVSSGNMRLAIMAAISIKEGKLNRLNSLMEIYEFYFQTIIDKMDKNLLIVGALLAFFDSLLLDIDNHIIYELLSNVNIDAKQMKEVCHTLHNLEVVDIYSNRAVKFNEQGLGNFLLYLVLYKEKWVGISDIIDSCFQQFGKRVIYACNTLLNLFHSEELRSYAFLEIRKSWGHYATKDSARKREFLLAFHIALRNETLRFIHQEIDLMPNVYVDFLTYDFKAKNHNQSIKSVLLKMLAGFKRSEEFSDAIQLLFRHLEQNTKDPCDFFVLIKSYFLIDNRSNLNNYEREHQLLILFWDYYLKSENSNVAVLLIYICEWLLKFEYSIEEAISELTISYRVVRLQDCKAVREIRDKCIDILFYLYNDSSHRYKKRVLDVLHSYVILTNYKASKCIAEQDIIKINACIDEYFKMININECLVTEQLSYELERNDLLDSSYLRQFERNTQFMNYKKLRRDRRMNSLDRNIEGVYNEKITLYAESAKLEDFECLIQLMSEDNFSSSWEIGDGLSSLFNQMNQTDFFNILNIYFNKDTPFNINPSNIIKKIIQFLGYHESWKYIERYNFKYKNNWLINLAGQVEEQFINEDFTEKVLNLVASSYGNSSFPLPCLDLIYRIDMKYQGFAVKYLKVMLEAFGDRALKISDFLNIRGDLSYEKLLDIFDYPRVSDLEDAYLIAFETRQYFDYERGFLLTILSRSKRFLRKLIIHLIDHDLHEDVLNHLWKLDNYSDMISESIEIIRQNEQFEFSRSLLLKSIFSHKGIDIEIANRQDFWLEKYICENSYLLEVMEDIYSVLEEFSEERQIKFMLLFCEKNGDYNMFKALMISSRSSVLGSAIDHAEKKMALLNKVKDSLKGLDFLEHRICLGELIEQMAILKEDALVHEFMTVY